MIPHLLQSGDTETPGLLLKDFKWLQHCLVYTSPVCVITHFKSLLDTLDSENEVCINYCFMFSKIPEFPSQGFISFIGYYYFI